MLKSLLVVQLALTGYLAGLICVIQWVHYPLARHIDPAQWQAYQSAHMSRMFGLVGPAMVAELLVAMALVAMVLAGTGGNQPWAWVTAGCVVVGWAVTVLVYVPLHGRLADGYDLQLIERLTWWNWPRTAAWLVKLAGSAIWLYAARRD